MNLISLAWSTPLLFLVLAIEFVALVTLGLRVGTLLDGGLINKDKVNNYPNKEKYDKQHTDNPFPPTCLKDYEGTDSKGP